MTSHDHDHNHQSGCCGGGKAPAGKAEDVVRDPVCGMTVDPAAGKPSAEHDGHMFHFCSESCRDEVRQGPR